jgi:hypothetical protein
MHSCLATIAAVVAIFIAQTHAFVGQQARTTRSLQQRQRVCVAAAAASGDAEGEAETRVVHILPARVANVNGDPSTPLVDLRANSCSDDTGVFTSTQQQMPASSGKTTVVSLRVPPKHQSRYFAQLLDTLSELALHACCWAHS